MGYRTLLIEGTSEIVINKSRFIGYVKPISMESEATAFIEEIKKKHWDARHHVPVYVLGEKYTTQRYSDDGEPSGTAGVPILEMVKKEGITNVAIVIVRYFGGIKLGTGGLVRAYSQSAKDTLNSAGIVDVECYDLLSIKCEYHNHGKLQNYIMNDYYMIDDTQFAEDVTMLVYCKPLDRESFTKEIMEITNGKAVVAIIESNWLAVNDKEYEVVRN